MTSTTPRVIGLWSPTPGCGKSTVAELIEGLEPGCEIIPFADALKDMLAVLGQPAGEHISEGQLGDEPFDVIINNNGTLEQLRTAVHHALKP